MPAGVASPFRICPRKIPSGRKRRRKDKEQLSSKKASMGVNERRNCRWKLSVTHGGKIDGSELDDTGDW